MKLYGIFDKSISLYVGFTFNEKEAKEYIKLHKYTKLIDCTQMWWVTDLDNEVRKSIDNLKHDKYHSSRKSI